MISLDAMPLPVSGGKYFAWVDAADLTACEKHKWYIVLPNPRSRTYYANTSIWDYYEKRNRSLTLHRFLAGIPDMEVDHRDGDGLNNTRANLRCASHRQNLQNTKPRVNSKTGLKGVSFHAHTRKWTAQIQAHGKKRYLGVFDEQMAAVRVYNEWALSRWGEFAWLNRVEDPALEDA